ncbi:hypothetical protein G7Y89_g10479 [Cudoniella acicularis]|uniref:2EXR domain-containing protein n=1 Tax=Cudoniella acicularis TaxID=354080 RepID=A0A8H4W1K5_9HELO|nr:hypothetical protein G7Y89_g10479 [Cudoniella acicularis]
MASSKLLIPHPSQKSLSDLPFELRTEIWNLTFIPQIIKIESYRPAIPSSCNNSESSETENKHVGFFGTVLSPCPSTTHTLSNDATNGSLTCCGPVALYVCHESRALALKRYVLTFGSTSISGSQPSAAGPISSISSLQHVLAPKIWIDFSQDLITNEGLWGSIWDESFEDWREKMSSLRLVSGAEKVERVALVGHEADVFQLLVNWGTLFNFEKLREVVVFLEEVGEDVGEDGVVIKNSFEKGLATFREGVRDMRMNSSGRYRPYDFPAHIKIKVVMWVDPELWYEKGVDMG